jgi:hypothetical protein
MNQPKIIQIAIFIYFASIALSFIGAIPNYLAADPRPPFIGVLLTWVIMYGLFIGLGYAIKLGKNWARHTNAVITVVSLITIFFAETSPLLSTDISQIILVLNNIASCIVLILLYTNTSNEWFKAVKA